jgi:hypothetical protein
VLRIPHLIFLDTLGVESTRMLIERIQGGADAPRQFVLKSELIERESVGAPPIRHAFDRKPSGLKRARGQASGSSS